MEETHTILFSSSAAAWAFMRACDVLGVPAGFPSLRAPQGAHELSRTVQVCVTPKNMDEVYRQALGGERVDECAK